MNARALRSPLPPVTGRSHSHLVDSLTWTVDLATLANVHTRGRRLPHARPISLSTNRPSTSIKPAQAILVVKDEAAVALELGRLLQVFGYRVLGPAFTVRQALEMVEAEPPDAALLDLNVGGERVTVVAEALKARNVPFGLVTASADIREPELKSAPMVRKPISDGDEIGRLLDSVLPAN